MLKIAEYTKRGKELKKRALSALKDSGVDFSVNRDEDKIKLVFAGQYSAGKSSIIKMLTGRSDIDVGAGITTQETHSYEWNGLIVIDTPGIGTEIRIDHDEISYKAINAADMLVFVVTNELFDSHLAEHFRKLAIEKDKAGEMILVINKMERTSEGNTTTQQDVIREDLRNVLKPYTPEQLNLCFLDAESYLETIDEDDPEIIHELTARSGYSNFIDTLNRFVSEKSLSSKLTTELYMLDEQLEKAIEALKPQSIDVDIDALEENYLQQRHVLIDARIRLQQEVKDIFTDAGSRTRELGLDSANLLSEGCKQNEVEFELEKYVRQADDTMDKAQQDATQVIEARLTEMGKKLDSIENSEFTKELKTRLTGKFDGLPENVKKALGSTIPGLQKSGEVVTGNAYKAGVAGGLSLSNFSGSNIHNIVLKACHAIGYKFKPWQAIKITKGVAVAGRVLGIVGVGLSVFMQIKEDADADRISADLKKNRQVIRSQFNTAANEFEDFGRRYIEDNVVNSLAPSISDLDEKIYEIRETRSNRSVACRNFEKLQRECQKLIQSIHSM